MNSTAPNPYGYLDQPQTQTSKKRRRWVTPTIAVGTLLAGFAIGAGASGATAEAPEPEVITETVTETVEVERTPQVCLDALDAARDGFLIASEMMFVIGPAVEAAFYHDGPGMEAATRDLEVLRADLDRTDFPALAAACEGAA